VRRTLLSVVAIAAIIVGVLAMHALSTGSHHTASADAGSASGSHHDAGIAMSESAAPALDACGAGCEPADAMVVAACILALLIVVIVLIPAASRQALLQMSPGTMRIVPNGSPARRRPPSLLVLSISRT
jgi:hypothetical protein